jgi:hypothetical protein
MKVVSGFFPAFALILLFGLPANTCAGQTTVVPAIDHVTQTDVSPTSQQVSDVDMVRIVRLSEVHGKVALDRGTGEGYQAAYVNFPIVQGQRLWTRDASWAEVEFEDNSTLRITPNSEVEFTALARDSSGAVRNGVKLVRGTMYVSLPKDAASGNSFEVKAGGETMKLAPESHVRLDLYPAGSSLVVVKGEVPVTDASGATLMADKKNAVAFGDGGPAKLVAAKTQPAGLYDEWDAAAVKYHSAGSTGNGSYQYGQRDLTAYGSFDYLDGCGEVWRPYFIGAGWDPFANGMWAYYPGAGYSFASAYPWGWVPFHYGEWVSCGPTRIWGWRRDRHWRGLKNREVVKPIHGDRPSEKAENGKHPTLLVHAAEMHSAVGTSRSFFFAKDSAGLGVPRDGFNRLGHISAEVEKRDAGQPMYFRDHLDNPTSDPRAAYEAYDYNRMLLAFSARGAAGSQLASVHAGASRPVMSSGGGKPAGGGYAGGGRSGGFSGGGFSGGGASGVSHASGGAVSTGSAGVSSSSSSAASSGGGGHH